MRSMGSMKSTHVLALLILSYLCDLIYPVSTPGMAATIAPSRSIEGTAPNLR